MNPVALILLAFWERRNKLVATLFSSPGLPFLMMMMMMILNVTLSLSWFALLMMMTTMIPLPKNDSCRPATAAFNLATLFVFGHPFPQSNNNKWQDAYRRRQGSQTRIFEGSSAESSLVIKLPLANLELEKFLAY
jgi:hypothetical protein